MTEQLTAAGSGVAVLYRDAQLLGLYKPSGLPTTSPDGKRCLTELAAQLDPGAPRLHASSRLDAEVTGVVTFARTSQAIEALLAARKAGRYERYYLAIAGCAPEPTSGSWHWSIATDPREPRRRIALDPGSSKGDRAESGYRVLGVAHEAALLVLRPKTGRTHQLRVHAARAGAPLLGDRHYGGAMQRTLTNGRVLRAGRVMLHCARVRLPHIAERRRDAAPVCIDAPLPEDFRSLWLQLGGDASALDPQAWAADDTPER